MIFISNVPTVFYVVTITRVCFGLYILNAQTHIPSVWLLHVDFIVTLVPSGNSCTASGSSDLKGPELQLCSRDFFIFVPAVLLSVFIFFYLPSSSVSLSFFNVVFLCASVVDYSRM